MLLVVTVALALAIASRIYSAGVLLYGQRVGIRSVLRAARRALSLEPAVRDAVTIGGGRLEIVLGDITEERVDAVANAANEALRGGGGVDGAIHRAAGPALLQELSTATRRAPHRNGRRDRRARAAARWIIHAVGPIWRGGERRARAAGGAYRSSLVLADELGARSVAFPAISMGIYGYPTDEGARVAVGAVADHIGGTTGIELVRFVLFSDETYGHFADALAAAG